MTDPVRLRQICLVTQDLEYTSSLLCAAFDSVVVFQVRSRNMLLRALRALSLITARPGRCQP